MFRKPSIPAAMPALVLLAAASILGAAFAFEHLGGYAPCKLCLYQRWPYGAAIVLSLIAIFLVHRRYDRLARAFIVVCGLGFVVGAALGGYHVGVEEGWWQGPTTCSGSGGADTVEALLAQVEAAPVVRCDQVQWRLLGLSMAGYNVLLSLGLAVLTLWTRLWGFIPGVRR
ncbi:MAG: disulfide bond formation protein B [Sphingomonadales bacterium]